VVNLSCGECGQPMHRIPQGFQLRVPHADSGQRNATEIYGYLNSKRLANKSRREAEEAARRKAKEGVRQNGN